MQLIDATWIGKDGRVWRVAEMVRPGVYRVFCGKKHKEMTANDLRVKIHKGNKDGRKSNLNHS
jgi:hypothetical protein